MRVRVITLNFDMILKKFNEDELQDFLKGKELLSFQDHFFTHEENPYLVLILKYLIATSDIRTPKVQAGEGKKETPPWREILKESDTGLFNQLREWRSEQCKKEGVPPYVLFNNEQLAQIADRKPKSLADLSRISGVGKAKVDKYGRAVLKLLHGEEFEIPAEEGAVKNEGK